MEQLIAKLLQGFEQGTMTRRQLVQSLALAATAASAASSAPAAAAGSNVVKTAYLNHVAYYVADYRRSRDWYADLFDMKVVLDDGRKANLSVGDEALLIFHDRKSPNTPIIDHVCFTIADWDADKSVRGKVEAELKRRGLDPRATEHSLFIKDPDGFSLQLGGKDQ
jgi:catechol 2,3-dioxygenase-like lactoylglutathione lyase family enzyme